MDLGEAISDADFRRIAEFVSREAGIQLPETKRQLVQGRLGKRLRNLKLGSFREYCDYVFESEAGQAERRHLVDIITTNKTHFFREPEHFEYLRESVIPRLLKGGYAGRQRALSIWSAACSTGEEPYTLAMVMGELQRAEPGLNYQILATDISTRVLDKAKRAIYNEDEIESVSMDMRRRYLLRSRDPSRGLVQVAPELRKRVRFGHLNLMDQTKSFGHPLDVIFCRNVMIYFDSQTREDLVRRFVHQLAPGGFLFVGHSETLRQLAVGLEQMVPAVYRKIA